MKSVEEFIRTHLEHTCLLPENISLRTIREIDKITIERITSAKKIENTIWVTIISLITIFLI